MRYETPWMKGREQWVKGLSDKQILRIARRINAPSARKLDEMGDSLERDSALQWLLTRGKGEEYGIVGVVAEELGMWSPP